MSGSTVPGGKGAGGRLSPSGRRRLWQWLLVAVVLVVAIIVVLFLLPRPAGSGGGVTPPAGATSTPTPTVTPAPTPSAAPTITEEDRAAIAEAIVSGDTAPLAAYLADPTNVILCASEAVGPLAPAEALAEIDVRAEDAEQPWDFALPAATLDEYRAKAYARYFPSDALVGRSADKQIFSFGFTGAQISDVFWCPAEQVVIEE